MATAAQAKPAPDDSGNSGGPQQLFFMLAVMAFALWFIVLRPQKKEKEERRKQLDALKKGDKVISIGGIHGKIADIDTNQNIITVEVAPKCQMKFSKAAIQTVNPKAQSQQEAKKEAAKADEEEKGQLGGGSKK